MAASVQPGSVIKELRIERGWTGAELARRSKISPAQISKIEKGLENLRVPTLLKIARALAIKPAVFLMTADEREAFDTVVGVRW